MLTNLYIKNFALIDELSIEFSEGLTIITGETGAGKSIFIGALNQVLGIRANSDLVRSGSNKAVVEAVLIPGNTEEFRTILEQADIDQEEELLLRREISAKGQSRCFVNDTPCTLQVLRSIGNLLIDLHGQHEHQFLLQPDTHSAMLDGFGLLDNETETYRQIHSKLREKRKECDNLQVNAERLQEKRDLLEYQLKELESLNLRKGEQSGIEEEMTLLEHSETRFELCSSLNELLYDSEHSAFVRISEAAQLLSRLSTIDKSFSEHFNDAETARNLIEETSRTVRDYSGQIEFNPDRLESLRQRQLLLQKAVKKYGKSIDELLSLKERIAEELSLEENLTDLTASITREIETLGTELSSVARKISSARKKTAEKLEKDISHELVNLGIPNGVFIVSISQESDENGDIIHDGQRYRAFDDGCDRIEFLLSTNIGESPKPLSRIASGGEISRVMLAMKRVLAEHTQMPILIFDEIDTGISGRIADAVGRSLRQLSKTHQIISITHLPQIAAMADRHLSVEKTVQKDRTVTTVRRLDDEEHVTAVAGLLSGKERSESSLRAAAELIEHAKNA